MDRSPREGGCRGDWGRGPSDWGAGSGTGGNAAGVGGKAPPVGAFLACLGARASEIGETPRQLGEKLRVMGETLLTGQRTVLRRPRRRRAGKPRRKDIKDAKYIKDWKKAEIGAFCPWVLAVLWVLESFPALPSYARFGRGVGGKPYTQYEHFWVLQSYGC